MAGKSNQYNKGAKKEYKNKSANYKTSDKNDGFATKNRGNFPEDEKEKGELEGLLC